MAICGLAGGAGTTTLAYQLALRAAHESRRPVLLSESEATLPGLAAIAGRTSPHAIGGSADALADDPAPEPPAVELGQGLSLLASLPRPAPAVYDEALRAVLFRASERHALVVVDCRTLDHSHAPALIASASHVVWTLPLSSDALAAGTLLHECGALPAPGGAREALVVTQMRPDARAPLSDLRELAERRNELLVVSPYSRALAARGRDAGDLSELTATLTQLATFLRRAS